MIEPWMNNLPWRTLIRVFLRDFYISKIQNPWQVFRRRRGWAKRDLFRHIKIQTNYSCTRKCSFCHYGLEQSPVSTQMPGDLFYRIIEQLGELRYSGIVSLYEINEPFTDPRMLEFIHHTRKILPRAWLFLTSNGDLLDTERIQESFSRGLSFLYLNSYDAPALKRNLQMLQKLGNRYQRKIRHIDRTYQTSWTSRAGNIAQFAKVIPAAPCDMVYSVMYIKPTGKVHSCINDFFNVNELGDLNHQSLLDVWFGERLTVLRDHLNRSDRSVSKLCSQCDYRGFSNLPIVPLSWRLRNWLAKFGKRAPNA